MTWPNALLLIYGGIVFVAVFRWIVFTRVANSTPSLGRCSPRTDSKDAPFVSILVPAKDEEAGIEKCIRRLLAQEYPNFEVIVVDDRSRDATASIVRRLAEQDERLRLLRVAELPIGWTGKTHALDVGQREARGEWLLFVDADTLLEPLCLTVAMRSVLDDRLDMITLFPRQVMESAWERAVQPTAGFCLMLLFQPDKINRNQRADQGFGNGQFLMARRTAYDAAGGHRAVRDKFLEDVFLAKAIRRTGGLLRVSPAVELLSLRMFAGLDSLIRGWSRIFYASQDGRSPQLWRLLFDLFLFGWLAPIMMVVATAAIGADASSSFGWILLALSVVQEVFETSLMAGFHRRVGGNGRDALLRPASVVVMSVIVLRAIWLCCTRKVEWRGTTYVQKSGQGLTGSDLGAGQTFAATHPPAL